MPAPYQVMMTPRGSAGGGTGVNRLQGQATIVSGGTTVPTPSGAAVDDYQFIIWNFFTNGSPSFASTGFGSGEGDWKMPVWAGQGNSSLAHHLCMRKITSGNIGTPFRVAQASGALTINYCTFVVRGLHLTDPLLGMSLAGEYAGTVPSAFNSPSRSRGWSPGILATASLDDLILAIAQAPAANTPPNMTVPAETAPVIFAAANVFTSGSTINMAYVLQRQASSEYTDLNGNGHPLDGWTSSLCTLGTTPSNIAQAFTVVETASGSGRYGIYKDFTLEAGKVYAFMVDFGQVTSTGTGTNETCMVLSYVKPDATEHAFGCNDTASATGQFGGEQTIATNAQHPDYSNNGSGAARTARTMLITPSVTGTYRLWVSMVIQSQLATLSTSINAHTGSTSRGFRGAYIRVFERAASASFETLGGMRVRNNATYRDVSWRRPLLAPNKNVASNIYNNYVVLRAPGGARPLCRMGGNIGEHLISASPSPNRTVANTEIYPYPAASQHYEYSDQCVGPWNTANGRYYFEATITALGNQYFGFMPAATNNREWANSSAPWDTGSSAMTHFAVAASNVMNNNGTITNPGAWTTNDVIGFLLDTVARSVTVTRNGVLWATVAISSDVRAMTWAYRVVATRSINGESGGSTRYTLNLTGPFLYKPTLSAAFDFDNEPAATLTVSSAPDATSDGSAAGFAVSGPVSSSADPLTITASGGTGPYTYYATRISGPSSSGAFGYNQSSGNVFWWSHANVLDGISTEIWRITAIDSLGAWGSVDVTANLIWTNLT